MAVDERHAHDEILRHSDKGVVDGGVTCQMKAEDRGKQQRNHDTASCSVHREALSRSHDAGKRAAAVAATSGTTAVVVVIAAAAGSLFPWENKGGTMIATTVSEVGSDTA